MLFPTIEVDTFQIEENIDLDFYSISSISEYKNGLEVDNSNKIYIEWNTYRMDTDIPERKEYLYPLQEPKQPTSIEEIMRRMFNRNSREVKAKAAIKVQCSELARILKEKQTKKI